MTHDEMIEVIAAHRDGKTIQLIDTEKKHDTWEDGKSFIWNFGRYNYRIKPEPLTLKKCWSQAWGSSKSMDNVLVEFIKLAKENGHA